MWLFPIAIVIFLLDQSTKFIALRYLNEGTSVPLITGIFHLTLVPNQGIAFGFFDRHAVILLLLIVMCVLVLLWFSFFHPPRDWYHQVAYGLILGGALGNLVDRIRLGYVIDFLDFRIWPVFNFADTFITIGVGLFILSTFKKSPHAS